MKRQSTNPKVSILVAVYNVEKYIGQCIKSIIRQDYDNLEIILVDDCSADNSGKICDKYAENDKRIKVIHHKKNTRQSGVRNTGLEHATGEYITFVDGDDWLASDFVSYMLKVITLTGTDIAINPVNFTTRNEIQVKTQDIKTWSSEKALAEFLFPHFSIGAWNKIYRRDFIEKNKLRFKDLYTAEGYEFVSRAIQKTEKVGVGHRKVYYYRLNNLSSATTKYNVKQSLVSIKVANQIKKDLSIKTPYVLTAINFQIWNDHFWNIRQITALNARSDYKKEYEESIKYIKSTAILPLIKYEPLKKKVVFIFASIFPVAAAKMKNWIFNRKLKKDAKNV